MQPAPPQPPAFRLGAVTYLNAKPLTYYLASLAPEAEIVVDLPSRLSDALSGGRLDVALVPSIEYFRNFDCTIVSDACVACHGPVASVMLYSRVPMRKIRTLALDEGSRTSAAMCRILLEDRYGIRPEIVGLPIGTAGEDSPTDAVMLIGDRAMHLPRGTFDCRWDLGEEWSRWTGLPFVFALWVARPDADIPQLEGILAEARDRGVDHLVEIARAEAPAVGVSEADCLAYLRDNLHFHLGPRERLGLYTFYRMASEHDLAPRGLDFALNTQDLAR